VGRRTAAAGAAGAGRDAATLRDAMELLGMGRVGDYFAHRWSDPTYLAGLALLQQHWPADRTVVEVACGAGHLLRELAQRGLPDLVGVDVVWAKLWLAQRFVCPSARYVCADVTDLPDLEVRGAGVRAVPRRAVLRARQGRGRRGDARTGGPGRHRRRRPCPRSRPARRARPPRGSTPGCSAPRWPTTTTS
jgi:hypothetical protein